MKISRRILKLNNNPLFSFNKYITFGYKKRIGYNHIHMQKRIKIDRDIDELTETVDWMDEGSEIQSHFYHEFLFNTLGKNLKITFFACKIFFTFYKKLSKPDQIQDNFYFLCIYIFITFKTIYLFIELIN